MKRILILDTETTGLDPSKDTVIEVAAAVYSVEHATTLDGFHSLVRAEGNPCEHINRIPPAALLEAPRAELVWPVVEKMIRLRNAEAIVAHSAEFDRGFAPPELREIRPWICSKSDLEWPRATRPESSLVPLALDHELGVSSAHRASADVDLLVRLFRRVHELGVDVRLMLHRGMRPKATFMAVVSYDDRRMAADQGFHWSPDRRQWLRKMFVEDATKEKLGFIPREVEPEIRNFE